MQKLSSKTHLEFIKIQKIIVINFHNSNLNARESAPKIHSHFPLRASTRRGSALAKPPSASTTPRDLIHKILPPRDTLPRPAGITNSRANAAVSPSGEPGKAGRAVFRTPAMRQAL